MNILWKLKTKSIKTKQQIVLKDGEQQKNKIKISQNQDLNKKSPGLKKICQVAFQS